MSIHIINLEKYRTRGAKIFTGRDRGQEVRIKSEIDRYANEFDIVEIHIPTDLFSINPSFFEELFVNVVKKYREEGFFKKFIFKNEGFYPYEKPLKEAVSRILRENTALD